MGNTAVLLAKYFEETRGLYGVSTLCNAVEKREELERIAIRRALEKKGDHSLIKEWEMERLRRFICKEPTKANEPMKKWRQRWFEKWKRRFPLLTPSDTPYAFGTLRGKGSFVQFPFYLDRRTTGATNHSFGSSRQETILEYALRKNALCIPLLVAWVNGVPVEQHLTAVEHDRPLLSKHSLLTMIDYETQAVRSMQQQQRQQQQHTASMPALLADHGGYPLSRERTNRTRRTSTHPLPAHLARDSLIDYDSVGTFDPAELSSPGSETSGLSPVVEGQQHEWIV